MFGSEILDVGIGLIFVFLTLGLFCSVVNELIARIAAMRARTLEDGIRNLLSGNDRDGADLGDKFYNHPLIKGLYPKAKGGKKPSYIPASLFSQALLDIVVPERDDGSKVFDDLEKTIGTLPDSDIKKTLQVFLAGTEKRIQDVRKNIENYFDQAMDRVSGWYRRKIQLIALIVALVVAVGLNADSLIIADTLYRDSTVRASVAAAATEIIEQAAEADSLKAPQTIEQVQEEFEKLKLPMGWSDPGLRPEGFVGWIKKLLGWLLTGLAVSLGAPFWFDVLSKVVKVRSTGKEIRVGEKENRKAKN